MKNIKRILLVVIVLLLGYYFFPEKKLPPNSKIDRIVVYKSKKEMQVYAGDSLLKTYKISLGKNPIGDKKVEGDKKTPEGKYFINAKNNKSDYYKNLGISYPNQDDIAEAKQIGKSAGGDIKIHGMKNGYDFIGKFHRWYNWTAGCIAVTNDEMDELYKAVEVRAEVEIRE